LFKNFSLQEAFAHGAKPFRQLAIFSNDTKFFRVKGRIKAKAAG